LVKDNGLLLLALALALIVWEVCVRLFEVPAYVLPAPSAIAQRIAVKQNELLPHAGWTAYEALLGYLAGLAIGLPLAVAIVYSRLVEKTLFALLVSSQSIPKIALAPLLVVLLGLGQLPKILIAFLLCFFPVVVSTVAGLKAMPVEMFHLARSLGSSGWQTFWKFRVPYALPNVFAGLKVAVTLAVIGAVIAEYVGGTNGLGYYQLIVAARQDMRTTFAIIAYLSVIGIVYFYLVTVLEKWVIRWDPSRQIERAKQR
jgi:NitT/TauT family transport system permease protein